MKVSIKVDELKRVIKALKPFTRIDQKIMQFIYLEVDKDTQEIRAEALDGHRIAVEYIKCQTDESFIAYIKPFTPWKTDALYAEIEMVDGTAIVDMGYYTLRFKQPEGEWYNTKKMIADTELIKPTSRVGINPEFMIDALKGVNLYGCKKPVIIETREKPQPVIIREATDKRNIRYILPVNIYDDAD